MVKQKAKTSGPAVYLVGDPAPAVSKGSAKASFKAAQGEVRLALVRVVRPLTSPLPSRSAFLRRRWTGAACTRTCTR